MSAKIEREPPSNDDIIEDVLRVRDVVDRVPRSTDYKKHGEYDQGTVFYRFDGDWANVLEAADLDASETRAYTAGPRVPKQDVLDDLVRVADELGHPPTVAQYRDLGNYSYITIRKRGGPYRDAIEMAGLDPDDLPSAGKLGRPSVPRDKILDDLVRVGTEIYEEEGRRPTWAEFNERSEYTAPTAAKRFDGDLSAGFDAVGIPPNENERGANSNNTDTDAADE